MNKVLVAEHLAIVARAAVIPAVDKGLINVPLKTLMMRVGAEFDRFTVLRTEVFGSFTRETRLPVAMDPQSDVDVMVIFRERGQKPSAYVQQLQTFAELHYPRAAIVTTPHSLCLQFLQARIELVPAFDSINGVQIPKPGPVPGWQVSDLVGAAKALEEKDKAGEGLILPVIRLAKYWNARNGYPFTGWDLEQRVLVHRFGFAAKSLKAYWFDFMRSLVTMPGVTGDKTRAMRRSLDEIDRLLLAGKPQEAEEVMEALLPLPESLLAPRGPARV